MGERQIGLIESEPLDKNSAPEVDVLEREDTNPVKWVETFLSRNNIIYDYQTSGYMCDGELFEINTIISKLRLALFEYGVPHLKGYIQDALRILRKENDLRFLNKVREEFKFRNINKNEFSDLIVALTGRYDELDEKVFRHWLWLVKRKIAGLPTENEMMLILYGDSGSGKSYFLRKLLRKIDELTVYTDMRVFNDKFGLRQFDRNRVMVFDELDMVGEVSVEKLKNIITSQTMSWRVMRSESLMKGRQNCSFIATTNIPVCEQIIDPTSSRRYWQLDTLPRVDWNRVNSICYDSLWQSIDEHGPSPISNTLDDVSQRQSETIQAQDEIDMWVKLSLVEAPISESSPSSTALYKSFEEYCSGNGHKSYSSFNQFCRQLQPKLKSKGFDGRLKEHRHNGTVWAVKMNSKNTG